MVQVNLPDHTVAKNFSDLPPSVISSLKQSDYAWFAEGENHDYISEDILHVTTEEINRLKQATADAHKVFLKAADYVIRHKRYSDLGIPDNLVELIELSWREQHPHMLSRFDLAGGVDGLPTKILEYNADMPTMIVESGYIQEVINDQYARLKYKGQFNTLHSKLVSSFQRLVLDHPDTEPSLLVTSLGYIEDQLNANFIVEAAVEAGLYVAYSDLENVEFSDEGVFLQNENGEYEAFNFLFKFVPWEFIAYEEPDLMTELTRLVKRGLVKVINPAYTIVLQSKGLLKYVYDQNRSNPLFLRTSFEPNDFFGLPYVQKVIFGRLGQNIAIFDRSHKVKAVTGGPNKGVPSVYQEFTKLYCDDEGYYYQAGVFIANNLPCCLSFRANESLIMDEESDFVPHLIES